MDDQTILQISLIATFVSLAALVIGILYLLSRGDAPPTDLDIEHQEHLNKIDHVRNLLGLNARNIQLIRLKRLLNSVEKLGSLKRVPFQKFRENTGHKFDRRIEKHLKIIKKLLAKELCLDDRELKFRLEEYFIHRKFIGEGYNSYIYDDLLRDTQKVARTKTKRKSSK